MAFLVTGLLQLELVVNDYLTRRLLRLEQEVWLLKARRRRAELRLIWWAR